MLDKNLTTKTVNTLFDAVARSYLTWSAT